MAITAPKKIAREKLAAAEEATEILIGQRAGSVGSDSVLSEFSNRNATVDICAFGEWIYTTSNEDYSTSKKPRLAGPIRKRAHLRALTRQVKFASARTCAP